MPLTAEEIKTLGEKSLDARNASYSPYSNFRVGAALLTQDNEYITGCNVENASYGGAICAERTAMVKAVSDGKSKFKALGIASDLNGPCSPCGICRQFVREFCSLDMPIYLYSANGDCVVKTLEELLPMSFGPDSMK